MGLSAVDSLRMLLAVRQTAIDLYAYLFCLRCRLGLAPARLYCLLYTCTRIHTPYLLFWLLFKGVSLIALMRWDENCLLRNRLGCFCGGLLLTVPGLIDLTREADIAHAFRRPVGLRGRNELKSSA